MESNNYSLDQVLSAFGILKQEKGVDKILNSVKEKIFGNELNEENIEEFKEFVRKFTSLYYLMKDKFASIERTSGERYFEHLREVVNNVLTLPNPNTQKVLIAIAHDSIEDTNKTFEGLAEDYGYEVALAVEAISKEDWENYLKFELFDTDDDNERRKQAKKERNEAYFSHLENFETFKEHVRYLANMRYAQGKIEKRLTEEEIEEIAKNALDVKFADRIHNLSTQWDPNDLEQVRKKLYETKLYFLNIAREKNLEAYDKMQVLILALEIRLNNVSGKTGNIIEKK